jgi:hypothetical protein
MKLVRENINEKFSEESDPIGDMGIGVKQIREFKKIVDEVANIPEKDISNLNFRDTTQKISTLSSISAYLLMFYLNEKYGLNFKPTSNYFGMFGGGEIGKTDSGNGILKLSWSTTMQSIKLTIYDTKSNEYWESPNCQSVKSIEGNLLKFSKQMDLNLKKSK